MTNFESFAIAICVIIVAIVGVWCLYTLIKLPENVIDAPDEAPYKIERQEHPFEDPEIKSAFKKAIKRKRGRPLGSKGKGYKKRSKYWGSSQQKAKLRKARAARKAKSKLEA